MTTTPSRVSHSAEPQVGAKDSPASAVESASEAVAKHVYDEVRARPWFRRIAQVGWVAKGVVYASLGWAALEISLAKRAPDEAEYTGIVSTLAGGVVTRALLAVIAVGLVFYILFRLLSVALIDDVDANAWAHRGAYLASALTYTTVSWAAATAAINGTTESGESSIETISKQFLESSGGRIVLVLAGVIALGIAAYFIRKGVVRSFMSQIDDDGLGTAERRFIEYTGAVGWIGRGLTVGIVAGFVTWASIDADPGDVRGIDSSMHRIANGTAGQAVVLGIGCCLLVYAVYCIVSAPRRRLAWDNNPEPCESSEAADQGANS